MKKIFKIFLSEHFVFFSIKLNLCLDDQIFMNYFRTHLFLHFDTDDNSLIFFFPKFLIFVTNFL